MNTEVLKVAAKHGARIGKIIIIEGTKTLIIGGFAAGVNKFFAEGANGVRDMKLDDYLDEVGINKLKKRRRAVEEERKYVDLLPPEMEEETEEVEGEEEV